MKKIILSTLLASSLVTFAQADTKSDALITHTELGYIQTGGNTDTVAFAVDAKAEKSFGKNIFALAVAGQYAQSDDVETNNKFFAELIYDYEITDRLAFNYLLGYKKDKFSAFNYQAYTGPGLKYKAIISDKHNLELGGNILYAVDDYSEVEYDANGEQILYPNAGNTLADTAQTIAGYNDAYLGYSLRGIYSWQMFDNLKFEQELSYRSSFEDSNKYFIFSKSALTSKLSDIFSAGLSYKIDYVNEAGDLDNTDTTLTFNIIMDY